MPGPRILVVDDDPDIQDYFGSLLEDNGYQVMPADNTEAALEMMGEFEPATVLIDVMMPGRSGLDLLVTLRNDPRWHALPVVMITGNDKVVQDDCRSYLSAHGGVRSPDAVLGKPIDQETLLATLARLCPALDAV